MLLLKTLKREYIDWKAVEEKHIPRRNCHGFCMSLRLKDEFSAVEWRNKADPYCKDCVQRHREHGTPIRCTRCRHWLAEDSFASILKDHNLAQRLCKTCTAETVKPRRCAVCLKDKPDTAFSENMWRCTRKADRTCMACLSGRSCSVCSATGVRGQTFSACEWDKPDGERKCFTCMVKSCSTCRLDKTKRLFSADQWAAPDGAPARICYNCNRRQCSRCFKMKGQREFDRHAWQLEYQDPRRVCLACAHGAREVGVWTCQSRQCKQKKPISEFSLVRAKYGATARGHHRRCNTCVERFNAECESMTQRSASQIQKRRRTE